MGSFSNGFFGASLIKIVEATITALVTTDWHYYKVNDPEFMSTAQLAKKIITEGTEFDTEAYSDFRDKILAHFASLVDKLDNNQSLGDFEYKISVLSNPINF